MDNKDVAKEWFRIAETDLASAEFLQGMRPIPVEVICYHCQQSAEKHLKGFLASKGEAIEKVHDLVRLNKLCQKYAGDFETIEEDCLMLTDYAVNVRYPFPMDVNEADMHLALKSAHRIKDFVSKKADLNE
jgi:HEPN domain-containing protein